MEPGYGRSRLGPGKDQDLDQELDKNWLDWVRICFSFLNTPKDWIDWVLTIYILSLGMECHFYFNSQIELLTALFEIYIVSSMKLLMYDLQVDTKLKVKIKSTFTTSVQRQMFLKSLTSYLLISEIVTRFFFNSRIDHKRVVGVPVNKRLANSLREGWNPRYSTELSKEIFVLA